jgi:DNA segregation ATPase FtsK/SpoIIIE, S-DNA-T family
MDDDDPRDDSNVTYLPGAGPAVGAAPARLDDPAGEVLEAELESEDEYRDYRLLSQRDKRIVRYGEYRREVAVAVTVTRRVASHDVTRAVIRNVVVYPLSGLQVTGRRLRDRRSNSRYERLMDTLEAAGDITTLLEVETRGEQAKQHRHDRRMDWVKAPEKVVKAIGLAVFALFALLLLLGFMLFAASGDAGRILAPINAVLGIVAWVVAFVAAAWALMLAVGPFALYIYLWNVGRRRGRTPTWVEPARVQGEARDVVPDEGAILSALRNLNYGPLNAKIKEGWVPRWEQPPVRDGSPGKGWHAQLQLPQGTPVEEIVKRQKLLAHNLVRLPVEVWPTEPKNMPGVLDLWVADQGVLSGPVAPWPLLNDGTCDYFKSVPVGVDIRGTVINGRLFEANYALAGMMGSGKTNLVLDLLFGGLLDPLVTADVFVFAENADYDPLRPLLRSLVKGPDPENAEKCMQRLRELFSELSERGRALAEHGVSNSVTRELALKDPRLRPRIMVIDECQNLFLSKHGDEATELALKLQTTARKYAITLIWVTPEPSSDSLPRKLMAVTSNKACYAIGDQISNDAVLGTGSYRGGISAVSLEPKTDEDDGDVGTAMCKGFTPRPGLMRTFYIPKSQQPAIVERALTLREKAGVTPALLTAAPDDDWDLLDDVASVLEHHPRLRTQEVLARLTELDRRYERWTFADLKKALPDAAKPYKTMGNWQVSRERVREAITDRDEIGSDEHGEE